MPPTRPPWIKKPSEKTLWVTAKLAARAWFRNSREHIVRECKCGNFDGVYETYFDGYRWWIKLPEPLPKSLLTKKEKNLIPLMQDRALA